MARDDDYYGDRPRPFPEFGGKMIRPPAKELDDGCGNPDCNPGSAGARAPGAPPSRTIRIDLGSRPNFPMSEMDSILREMLRGGLGLRMGATDSAEKDEAEPPESYEKAREAVEKWLIKAPEQAFDDIVGNEEALAQLRDAIQAPVQHAALYAAYGMKMPKGALLSGPPGCGKTMFARAAASEMRRLYGEEVEFICVSGADLQSKWVGETEERIKAFFTYAREYQAFRGHPLLIFMDEAEVMLPDRTGRVRRVAPWEESQVATFLAEMDGMQESGAFVLLATNRPEVIDQAVLRDGRCDFKITVKRPNMDAIEQILRNNFDGVLVGEETIDQLVFAAVEGLFDPHKKIADAAVIGINIAEHEAKEVSRKHFLLEHILSGAIAASVPARAKRHAFARDKATGEAKGVTVADVLAAVNDLFVENRTLDHSFALEEFKREMVAEAEEAHRHG